MFELTGVLELTGEVVVDDSKYLGGSAVSETSSGYIDLESVAWYIWYDGKMLTKCSVSSVAPSPALSCANSWIRNHLLVFRVSFGDVWFIKVEVIWVRILANYESESFSRVTQKDIYFVTIYMSLAYNF